MFLLTSFVIGIGLVNLEIATNPYVTKLGPEESETNRLNFAQSFNGLAATIVPCLGDFYILSGKEYSPAELNLMPEVDKISYFTEEAASVKGPYLTIGIILIILAILFFLVKFPAFEDDPSRIKSSGSFVQAWNTTTLRWAVVA